MTGSRLQAGDVERFKGAPFHAPLRRLDETRAARAPRLRWSAPEGSNIARAVLAAAWQFRVRPARISGREQVGSWVRIRIDYSIRKAKR